LLLSGRSRLLLSGRRSRLLLSGRSRLLLSGRRSHRLLLRGRSRLLLRISLVFLLGEALLALLLLFLVALGEEFGVLGSLGLVLLSPSPLEGQSVSLSLKDQRGNQTLDLGSLGDLLLRFLSLLRREFTPDHVLSDIILFAQVEEFSDLRSSLWSKSSWEVSVRETRNLLFSLFDNDEVQNGNVGTDDATPDGFTFALSISSGSVARVSFTQQKANSGVHQHSLLHGETLFIISTHNFENVTLEILPKGFPLNLLRDSLIVEGTKLQFIVHFDAFLSTSRWISDIELH